METRKCRVCGEEKPTTEFYTHGDYLSRACKECEKNKSKKYMKKYRREHPGCRKEESHKYYIKHRDEFADKQRERRKRRPEKHQAQSILNYRLRIGEVDKPTKCEVCGKEARLEAHHADYSKPLDVVWICRQCHYKLDEERREKERA